MMQKIHLFDHNDPTGDERFYIGRKKLGALSGYEEVVYNRRIDP
jgi:hypothetical protein